MTNTALPPEKVALALDSRSSSDHDHATLNTRRGISPAFHKKKVADDDVNGYDERNGDGHDHTPLLAGSDTTHNKISTVYSDKRADLDSDSSSDLTSIHSDFGDDDDPFLQNSSYVVAASEANGVAGDRQNGDGGGADDDDDDDDDNNNDSNDDNDINERPSKRRRTQNAVTPPPPSQSHKRKPVTISPPWKKVAADGPSTILDESGKRKSGRLHRAIVESPAEPPPKRPHRAVQQDKSTPTTSKSKQDTLTPATNGHTLNKSSSASTRSHHAKKPKAPPTRTSPRTTRKPSPPPPSVITSSPRRSSTRNRNPRPVREKDSIDVALPSPTHVKPEARPTRIRLRVKSRPPLTTIPIVHPAQVHVLLPGQTITRPSIAPTFSEYVEKAPAIDVKDGGWQDLVEDGLPFTDEQAEKDAKILLRAEEEVEPGGILSEGRCSLLAPEALEEPPRQWSHQDHFLKAGFSLRKLMVMEHQRHRATAKRLAETCREEWLLRQPKTEEEVEAEARDICSARYKTVVKTIAGTWENVRVKVNRRRLEEWQAAEQKRVKAALNEAVSKSELQLQARLIQLDSDGSSNDEDDDENDDDDEEDGGEEDEDEAEEKEKENEILRDDPDNDNFMDDGSELGDDDDTVMPEPRGRAADDQVMSSSDDDEDARSDAEDAQLTQEQLREKYANVPELSPQAEKATKEDVNDQENVHEMSDESVDMDDDMGSSDEDMDSEVGADETGSDASEDEPPGLLGMLFGKSELQEMRTEIKATDSGDGDGDVEMADLKRPINDDGSRTALDDITHQGDKIATNRDFGLMETEEGTQMAEPSCDLALPVKNQNQNPDQIVGMANSLPVSAQPSYNEFSSEASKLPSAKQIIQRISAVTEQTQHGQSVHIPVTNINGDSHAVASVELAGVSETSNTTPGTDVVMHAGSPGSSQTPRTSDTKPTDLETSSFAVRSGGSRSSSPTIQAPHTEVPFLLRGTLREYQHFGLDWLAGLYQNKTNGILADEMGLGKTIQTIALLAHLACHHEVWGPHLVIVPTSVMLNWEMEFKKWCPGFKVLSYYGSIEERKRKRQGWKTDDVWNVCITSYQIVLQDNQVFKRRQWHYMILDEAHNIKNFKSKRWQTLLGFNTQARLLLTGTPLQNNLTELWSLLFFLMPSENGVGGFADLAEFQDWFRKPESQILESGREQMDDEARAIIAKLHKVLRPYLLRRLKADVEKQMPAKYEHVEFCRLSRRQRELYDGFLARADTRESLASGNYISVINCLMQLRKVCNHPDLFVERPIMTSFRQRQSVVATYEGTARLVQTRLAPKPMSWVNLDFLNLVPIIHENLSSATCQRTAQRNCHGSLVNLREAQKSRAQLANTTLDPSSLESSIAYLESTARWGRFDELQHCVYVNSLRRQQQPIYGKQLREFLTITTKNVSRKPRPRVPAKVLAWFQEKDSILGSMVRNVDQRAAFMKTTIAKFACVTPAVVTRDLEQFVLGSRGVTQFSQTNLKLAEPIRYAPFMPKEAPLDPWHESRMRLSIQFPDRRLLQYDCGKLQALDRLLRKLQAGGHRALIFTQMTKVLDILEQFLNIHGHKYLRLDGATKVEQRQILTDRFNHDTRILAFILSTRSGGLGINLTGADTVIFYDQDWNPAMDKQCQDRCHRIGQTRDVHIYRLVSEHTIEANILRKASQKQMLDDVVIQEGGFTTDYFNRVSVHDVMQGVGSDAQKDMVGDAMDRVLGKAETGGERAVGRVLEQAEDREDVAAAHIAEKEGREDEADFEEKAPTATASGNSTAGYNTPATKDLSVMPVIPGIYDGDEDVVKEEDVNAWGERMQNIDEFMLGSMGRMLEGTPLELPRDKKKGKNHKKGKDYRRR